MCAPHMCPQRNLWACICLCLGPGVHACACVSAAGCVSPPVFVSVCIWAFVSVCVAVGPGLPTGLSLGWCVRLGVSVSVERCVSLSCACLRRATSMPWAACLRLGWLALV